ncbi:MAG: ATP-binding protein, partial [Chloroflexi bacterium]|nr:ATP-binding protein [Chloroflexota bacterium]
VNLLDNAIKYSPKGGKIAVEAQTTGDEVVISVQDHGAGIPLQRQQQLFQPFQRLTDGAPNIPGTGLGLFISQAIIRAHGGRIWVESQRGKGSRLTFTLPRQERAFLPAIPFSAPLSLGPPAPASGKAGKPRPKRTTRQRR